MERYFVCPLCKRPLAGEQTLRCRKNHSFDVAAQGYVHLLPSNRMHAKLPGDSREMVAARRRFLDAGHYRLFLDAVCEILCRELKGYAKPTVLDAGCGEGYYTDGVARALAAAGIDARVCGFDISKHAVRAAAGRNRTPELAVASCFDIPAPDASADALLSVFSPIVPEEFARVVAPGGILLLAVASPNHLWGLKELLYEKPYPNERRDTEYPGFSFLSRTPVETQAVLEGKELIGDLFAMTPYYWKTPATGAKRLAETACLRTEIGFDLLLYRRDV